MANNPYVNKVSVNGQVKIDLTADTVDSAHLVRGYTAHSMSGASITGSLDVPRVQSSKSYSALSRGTVTISPDSGYDAMGSVSLSVDIPIYDGTVT